MTDHKVTANYTVETRTRHVLLRWVGREGEPCGPEEVGTYVERSIADDAAELLSAEAARLLKFNERIDAAHAAKLVTAGQAAILKEARLDGRAKFEALLALRREQTDKADVDPVKLTAEYGDQAEEGDESDLERQARELSERNPKYPSVENEPGFPSVEDALARFARAARDDPDGRDA
jgi:hypothetical protein